MKRRQYHQARWNEPLVCEMGSRGERGILIPAFEAEDDQEIQSAAEIPEAMRRTSPPSLPEISQVEVLRHYLRLSQENLGAGLIPDFGMATSTMKYNPPINEQLARNPKLTELHPLQDETTIQGILEIMYQLEQFLKEISGMDRVSLQPRAGSQAIYANAAMMRAYHARHGAGQQRDEIITTIFSHPSNAAVPGAAGFKIITLHPQANGYPDLEALKAAVSERTAGLFITNPDDTGIFNPLIREFTETVHAAGGLCAYDQANANGLLGIVRARESGFDLSQFNLHKTFSTPHASGGPATGVSCVTNALADFLPTPTIEFDGEKYYLDYDRPCSIGKVASFYGVAANFVRAHAWIMAHGVDGLREVAHTAVLNNNYLMKKILQIRGVSAPYAAGQFRIDQTRYSWQKLTEETGLKITDISNRSVDFAMHFFYSHHPYVVEDPATLEPTESYSQHDIDEYIAAWARIADDAYCQPEIVRNAPFHAPIHQMTHEEFLTDPDKWAPTWRAFRKKYPNGFGEE
ncbi:MAG TPA: aminomethyl-transferring glycine dehydrogenase subunit GcvPB [Anaerolineales bacterium]|nr:aminomethyl-transferring glycine dehydrogenase subunit GcvPB [Anaerolineales bacterium]